MQFVLVDILVATVAEVLAVLLAEVFAEVAVFFVVRAWKLRDLVARMSEDAVIAADDHF